MRWYSWIFTAILTAIFGLFAAGMLAALLVDWYNISSFEGGSGFFVVFIALFGGIAGFVVGLIAAFVVSRRADPGFLKAVAVGWGAALAIVLAIGGIARFLADIPPTLGGETLLLQVELRYPPGRPRPAYQDGAYLRLHSATMSTVRKSEDGPLWLEDAREENGQWIVPGVVDVFTQRGRRLLDAGIKDTSIAGFIVPLPGHPRAEHESWSEWLPKYQPGTEPAGGGFTYRFRIVRRNAPIRTVHVGAFEIGVISSGFFRTSGTDDMASRSTFAVTHGGQKIAGLDHVDYVGVLPGASPVLFVRTPGDDGTVTCRFVVSTGETAQTTDVGPCVEYDDIEPVTSDPTLFARARQRKALEGWPDRVTFQVPGLYRLSNLIVDTRSRSGRRFTPPTSPYTVSGVPPLGVSPDERSIVLLAREDERSSLVVCDTMTEESYVLPIDRARMRFFVDEALDPAWVDHHFEWTKGAGGRDVLRERAQFEPLAYKGEFKDEYNAPSYSIGPGKEPLGEAVTQILTTELGAETLPDGEYGFKKRVRLEGKVIEVTVIEGGPYVYVAFEESGGDVNAMRSLAARLDAAFATHKWDGAFGNGVNDK